MKNEKFWAPETYIPILGMLCGSTISGVVVSVTTVLREPVSTVSSPTSPASLFRYPKSNMSLLSMCDRLTRPIHSCMDVQTLSFMRRDNKDKVETYLAFGASRFEACRPIATEALKVALTPNVNQMSVIGLISIPGPYSVSCLPPTLCLAFFHDGSPGAPFRRSA